VRSGAGRFRCTALALPLDTTEHTTTLDTTEHTTTLDTTEHTTTLDTTEQSNSDGDGRIRVENPPYRFSV
jgi:hypothetical protein